MQNLQRTPRQPVNAGVKIQVEATAMQKLWLWTDFAKGEVSCLGLVDEVVSSETGRTTALIVTDFFLVKQQCTYEETDMDVADVARLISELETKGIDSRKLRCWAHSHGSMSVFWSGQDESCISGLANNEWFLSLVVNKRRDTQMRLDQFHPSHMYIPDVQWEVKYPLVDGLAEACFDEFKAKVREATFLKRTRDDQLVRRDMILDELDQASARGALTMDELDDELNWLGIERDDFETF
ncbi:MAG: hypothetical protein IPK53_11740 [bacterium]|nr:hypothetical protein [bacterium]